MIKNRNAGTFSKEKSIISPKTPALTAIYELISTDQSLKKNSNLLEIVESLLESNSEELEFEVLLGSIQKPLQSIQSLNELLPFIKLFQLFPESLQETTNLYIYQSAHRLIDYTSENLQYLTEVLKSLQDFNLSNLSTTQELILVNITGSLKQLITENPSNESIPRILHSLKSLKLPDTFKTSLEGYISKYDLSQFDPKPLEIPTFTENPNLKLDLPEDPEINPESFVSDSIFDEDFSSLTTQSSIRQKSEFKDLDSILDSLPIKSWEQITAIEPIQRLNEKGIEVIKAAVTVETQEILVAVKIHLSKTIDPRISMQADYMAVVQDSPLFLKLYGAFWDTHKGQFRFILVMELAQETLSHRIHQWNLQKLPKISREPEALNAATQLITAMMILNQKNISHRDIKPDNIFITENNSFKIADFDISQKIIRNAFGVTEAKTDASVTGSRKYFSPELVALANDIDLEYGLDYNKSDVYSLGISILSMVTTKDIIGWNAYTSNLQMNINKIIDEEVQTKELKELIKRMMTVNPNERPKFRELVSFLVASESTIKDEFE